MGIFENKLDRKPDPRIYFFDINLAFYLYKYCNLLLTNAYYFCYESFNI